MTDFSEFPSFLKVEPIIDLNSQTVEYSRENGARISRIIAGDGQLRSILFPETKATLYHTFRRGGSVSKTGECLGYRKEQTNGKAPYVWLKFDDVLNRAKYLARGMLKQNIPQGQSSLIGIYSINRPEWIITEHACYEYSMVLVPLYDTLGHDGVTFIIQQTNMELIVVDKPAKVESLLKRVNEYQHLRIIVVMDDYDDALRTLGAQHRIDIMSFSHLEELGRSLLDAPAAKPPEPSDLATICYTSGTTGLPKGVMLTHANIVADCSSLCICKYAFPNCDDVVISYLPLAHMFERVVESMVLSVGGKIGFFRGDVRILSEDMQELRPTIMPTVPRLLNRIYDRVMAETRHSALKQWILNYAVWSKSCELSNKIIRSNSWWDCIVFRRIRARFGGRLKLVITGSAPCSPEILTFIRAALGCVVMEGYGQTECVAAAAVTLEGDHVPGQVGPPLPCCTMKLIDVEEMNYHANDGIGEVCIKGPIVFPGYYKDEAKTKEAIDQNGWLHTGDIGCWTERGTLQLIDRKKHIFKLSQGEYIAPEKLEGIYSRCLYIQQIFVYGESLRNFLIAVVVPSMDALEPELLRLTNVTVDKSNIEALNQNEVAKKIILDEIKQTAKDAKLHSFEEVKAIYITAEPFTVENGLLTPTFKCKRLSVKQRYAKQLDYVYNSMPADPKFDGGDKSTSS